MRLSSHNRIMAYQNIDSFFKRGDEVSSAAEAHGLATGMLCVNGQTQSGAWIKQLFDEGDDVSAEQARQLAHLFEETRASLESGDYGFEPFLPADDVPLREQIAALADWCQGFLFGVGALYQNNEQSGQTREILRDIAEFTRLDPDAEGEEDEVAFMEVTEYLRTAVLLLRAELASNGRVRIH
jgi:yecA family protein